MLFLLLGASAAVAGPDEEDRRGPGPLPWRVGGRLGFTVDAAAFPTPAGVEQLEAYVRLPLSTLHMLETEDGLSGRLRVTIRLRNQFGALHHEASQEFDVAARDTVGLGKVMMLSFPVKGGRYKMLVRLEDLRSQKRGLAYVGRKVVEAASIEGFVDVPAVESGRRLSDVGFLWGETSQEAAAFHRDDVERDALPNPERLYGLLATELRAEFRAIGSGDRPWHWAARVLDGTGATVAERESTAAAAAMLTQTVGFEMSTAPAGGYDLEIQVRQQGDSTALVRRRRFSIAWQAASWVRSPRDVEDDVHFLLDSDGEEAFARMSPGEQERYLADFWRELDPTPATAENEVRSEFYRRVEHANRTWTRSSIDRGMFTDMGRVYIRHGEPDEVLRQVIPAGDQTLNHLLEEIAVHEDKVVGGVDVKGLGGDVRPFEVWIYEGGWTRPITARPEPRASARAMRKLMFLFVDEQGYGDYRQRYSNE